MKVYAKQVYNALLKIYESVSDIPTDELMRLAIEEFGTTSSLRRAGYILPNGTLLKFSDGDSRDVDIAQSVSCMKIMTSLFGVMSTNTITLLIS